MDLIAELPKGNRRALARAITLVESTRAQDRDTASELMAQLPRDRQALRIGLSGTPGVGKSTFIESFGLHLTAQGLRVAVLAVDPSSARSGGSILGDKTRMEQLSRDPNAFIRPSPSQNQLGGVARRTREVVRLCEAAGFDVVLIETVGVGQSETMVADISDVFALLMAPAGGDELQGVKRGIMEIADLVIVNKADGDLKAAATRTCADYAGALRLLRKRSGDPVGFPKASMVSALTAHGLDEVWADIKALRVFRQQSGFWQTRRQDQDQRWFDQELHFGLLELLHSNPKSAQIVEEAREAIHQGTRTPVRAAAQILASFRKT
jgi:LAO/AO transport system kinase